MVAVHFLLNALEAELLGLCRQLNENNQAALLKSIEVLWRRTRAAILSFSNKRHNTKTNTTAVSYTTCPKIKKLLDTLHHVVYLGKMSRIAQVCDELMDKFASLRQTLLQLDREASSQEGPKKVEITPNVILFSQAELADIDDVVSNADQLFVDSVAQEEQAGSSQIAQVESNADSSQDQECESDA